MTKTNVVATLPIEAADLNVAASATAAGLVELATDAEAKTGTDTVRAITAANLRAAGVFSLAGVLALGPAGLAPLVRPSGFYRRKAERLDWRLASSWAAPSAPRSANRSD